MSKALLAQHKLPDFVKWVQSQGYKVLENKGGYELLRFKTGVKGEPMPIIFEHCREAQQHYTCSKSAEKYVRRFIKEAKQ